MPGVRPGAEMVGVAALPSAPRFRPARAVRLRRSYVLAIAAALLAASAARVPSGPVAVMAVLMAANALVLTALVRRPQWQAAEPPSMKVLPGSGTKLHS